MSEEETPAPGPAADVPAAEEVKMEENNSAVLPGGLSPSDVLSDEAAAQAEPGVFSEMPCCQEMNEIDLELKAATQAGS